MTATVDSELDQPEPPDEGLPADITDYVTAVRAGLTDLDADEIDDLTDDLHSHLAELRAETDEPFDQIIGSPEHFAAELRQSAGLAQTATTSRRRGRLTRATERISRRAEQRLASVAAHRWTRAVLDFLPELRPAWWVARGYLLTVLLALMTGGRLATFFLVPSIAGSTVAGFGVLVAFIVASVRFGRRNHPGRWARWAAAATAVLGAWMAVILFDEVSRDGEISYVESGEPVAIDGLFVDGQLPANFYAVLPDGTPLDQVLLYDESGAPISLPPSGYSLSLDSEWEAEPAVNELGHEVGNLFPRRLLGPSWSTTGEFEYDVLEPPTIEVGVPVTPTDGP